MKCGKRRLLKPTLGKRRNDIRFQEEEGSMSHTLVTLIAFGSLRACKKESACQYTCPQRLPYCQRICVYWRYDVAAAENYFFSRSCTERARRSLDSHTVLAMKQQLLQVRQNHRATQYYDH
jgi:hypothetical protein